MDSDGSELGFSSLLQSIFEFIQALIERKKYKAMMRKVLPEVVYFIISYLCIPEYQVKIQKMDGPRTKISEKYRGGWSFSKKSKST